MQQSAGAPFDAARGTAKLCRSFIYAARKGFRNRSAALAFGGQTLKPQRLCSVLCLVAVAGCGSDPIAAPEMPPTTVKRPEQIPTKFSPGDCRLQSPAFCESFEQTESGGRGGEINDKLWSFARLGLAHTKPFSRALAYSNSTTANNTPTFCGAPFSAILPPGDVRICEGIDGEGFASKQLHEMFSDSGGFASNSMRIRQPLDFRGRTATIVFDLDAKINSAFDGHGWWNEIWISQDPVPLPYHGAPTIASYPKNAIGFQIAPSDQACFASGLNQVGKMFIAKDYNFQEKALSGQCFRAQDSKLNRFKILLSTNKVEFWVTHFDAPQTPILVASAQNLGLNFDFGYVHFQHSQYNANKANASTSQTYRWDNIGFDGPAYPTPRGYDVPNELKSISVGDEVIGTSVGYHLKSQPSYTFKLPGVDLSNALRATFNFDFVSTAHGAIKFRFNGNAWHEIAVPGNIPESEADSMRALSADVPPSELISGENTLEIAPAQALGDWDDPIVGNLDLTIDPAR